MRNYRELTPDEIDELGRLYPVTPNRLLCQKYGISLDSLMDNVAAPRGWKKDRASVLIGSRGGKSLTERQVSWIINHYAHTKNADIMEKYGIGESTLHRLARKYGLKKSKRYMTKTQRMATDAAHEVCRRYGVYEETRRRMRQEAAERKERGERPRNGFQPGVTSLMRLGARRERERIRKAHASRKETIRRDRLRVRWGLEPITKMNLTPDGYTKEHHRKSSHRHVFRRFNYIVDRGSNDIYYDELTERRPLMESHAARYGLRIMPA